MFNFTHLLEALWTDFHLILLVNC